MKNTIKSQIIFIFVLSFVLTGCFTQKEGPRTAQVLGTVCTVNAYEQGTKKLYDQIFDRLIEIENDFSVNIAQSEVSKININAGKNKVQVKDDVYFVIKSSIYYASISDGAFDPTIGPLVKLWNISSDNPYVPSQEEIEEKLCLVNYKDVVLDDEEKTVFLTREGMSLDLGGIAKGYAADEVANILQQNNIKRAIIDLGGNILVYGTKKDKSDWQVGIKDPYYNTGSPALIVKLSGTNTVVTSGVYERFFIQDGEFYHHIIDTKTGYPYKTNILSSSIITTSSMMADAFSTISFIKGINEFSEIVKNESSLSEIGYIFIDEECNVFASRNLQEKLRAYSSDFESNKYALIEYID